MARMSSKRKKMKNKNNFIPVGWLMELNKYVTQYKIKRRTNDFWIPLRSSKRGTILFTFFDYIACNLYRRTPEENLIKSTAQVSCLFFGQSAAGNRLGLRLPLATILVLLTSTLRRWRDIWTLWLSFIGSKRSCNYVNHILSENIHLPQMI